MKIVAALLIACVALGACGRKGEPATPPLAEEGVPAAEAGAPASEED